jgi:hypothetical protein
MGECFRVLGESLIPENNSLLLEIPANEPLQRWDRNPSSVILMTLFFSARAGRKDRELYTFERSFMTVLV